MAVDVQLIKGGTRGRYGASRNGRLCRPFCYLEFSDLELGNWDLEFGNWNLNLSVVSCQLSVVDGQWSINLVAARWVGPAFRSVTSDH